MAPACAAALVLLPILASGILSMEMAPRNRMRVAVPTAIIPTLVPEE